MTFGQAVASALKVVPSIGHRMLINLSSLHIPQPCLDSHPLPILQRQPQPQDELNRKSYRVRCTDMLAHQIPSAAFLEVAF